MKAMKMALADQLLEKFLQYYERKAEKGLEAAMTPTDRRILTMFADWLIGKYTLEKKADV
jgi:hypothetical protein